MRISNPPITPHQYYHLANTLVHTGFLLASVSPPFQIHPAASYLLIYIIYSDSWISIAPQVMLMVKEQLLLHSAYTLVVTGHSLGGALAVLAALTLKHSYFATDEYVGTNKKCAVRVYSYGAPRMGVRPF